ncbi:hypothetical protein NE848_04585 [Gramella jeungdoensis]|uniref:Secreted protein n=1 Tax=Gramella jeungdoensis TaxID=708091 RepID=A0ABT0YYV0_9FLAO|nr:hypothetical protein [Gramella jeungdoensis]MCM8568643.1 hypothetical protein [Gramella jeungdoensis]
MSESIVNVNVMKISGIIRIGILLVGFMIISSAGLNAQVTKKVRAAKKTEVKSYEVVVSDLESEDPAAAQQALKWKTAKNFMLTKEGNFIPYLPTREGSDSESKDDISAAPVNCVKISCPEGFKPEVVCWECH